MSDARTPTHDQLSALCAQMAEAVELAKSQFELLEKRLKDMPGCALDATFAAHAASMTDTALTAYRALSPDPVWQRVPEGYEVVNLPSVNTIVDLIKHHVRVSVSNYGLSAEMEDMDDAAIAILNRARGEG